MLVVLGFHCDNVTGIAKKRKWHNTVLAERSNMSTLKKGEMKLALSLTKRRRTIEDADNTSPSATSPAIDIPSCKH